MRKLEAYPWVDTHPPSFILVLKLKNAFTVERKIFAYKTKSVSFESQLWQQQFTADDSPTMDRSDPPAAGGGLRSRLMTVPCGIEVGKAVSGK